MIDTILKWAIIPAVVISIGAGFWAGYKWRQNDDTKPIQCAPETRRILEGGR